MAATSAGVGRAASQPGGGRPRAIEVRGLHKSFGQVRAVQGVDLAIASGEIVALLGPNGAGQTSTIDEILGWVANAVAWLVIFGGGAIWRFRMDTARV